ncbi:MAG: hypothetical protein RIQ94_165 [Pseudomonadota bacterium]|jgi:hypothetical protein
MSKFGGRLLSEHIVKALGFFGILTKSELIEKLAMIEIVVSDKQFDDAIQQLLMKPSLIKECDILGYYKLKR